MPRQRPEDERTAGLEPELEEGAQPAAEVEYRRRRKPVPVRRRRGRELFGWIGGHGRQLAIGLALAGVAGGAYALLFRTSWFVLAGSEAISVSGAVHADPGQIRAVFAADYGRNVFFIPLEPRRAELLAMPWVASAEVLRLLPAQLQVRIHERTPVAFARAGEQLWLVDGAGVLLPRPTSGAYNFPIVTGLSGAEAAQPDAPALVAERAPQMKLYLSWRDGLDAQGAHATEDFSEVDVHDPADLEARVRLPGGQGTTLIHFGDQNFGARYALFQSQVAGWEQKYPGMTSVDLHYEGEAIVDPGPAAAAAAAASAPPAAKARGAGGPARGGKKPGAGRGRR